MTRPQPDPDPAPDPSPDPQPVPRLRMASCQAPNADYIARALADYLAAELGWAIEWVDDIGWPERYAALEQGALDLVWICGAPYARLRARGVAVQPLAAPVWRAPRYRDTPVYFSDVVVRADSPWQQLADLRGAHWGYNEPNSFSGAISLRAELARLGLGAGFFGAVTEAGSHQQAIRLLLAGAIDAAAIDSTVLEEEVRRAPDLAGRLRIVHTIGPAPMPPWVASPRLDAARVAALRSALAAAEESPAGRRLLAETPVARLAPVDDADYDAIRHLLVLADAVPLAPAQSTQRDTHAAAG